MTGWAPGVPRNSSANFLGWGRGGRHAFTEAAPAVSPGGEEYRLPRPADQGGASIAWDDAARTGQGGLLDQFCQHGRARSGASISGDAEGPGWAAGQAAQPFS